MNLQGNIVVTVGVRVRVSTLIMICERESYGKSEGESAIVTNCVMSFMPVHLLYYYRKRGVIKMKKQNTSKKPCTAFKIKMRSWLAVLAISALLFSLAPMTAFAASDNSMDRVVQIKPDHVFTLTTVAPYVPTAPVLRIVEKTQNEFQDGEHFRLILTNAEWNISDDPVNSASNHAITAADYQSYINNSLNRDGVVVAVEFVSKTTMSVTITNSGNRTYATKSTVFFPLHTIVTSVGQVQVSVDPMDSRLSAGTYTFAYAEVGRILAFIERVNTFDDFIILPPISIDETRAGVLPSGQNEIKMTLPARFRWFVSAPDEQNREEVTLSGGFFGSSWLDENMPEAMITNDGRTLEIKTDIVGNRTTRGSIFLSNFRLSADSDAPYANIQLEISGTNITPQKLLVARYITDATDPYATKIYNAQDLQKVRCNLSGSYILMNDIVDLHTVNSGEWTPIGDNSTETTASRFTGVFDGQGYVIHNLRITGEYQYAGLFGYAEDAIIKNVGLEGTSIDITSTSDSVYVGGICGYSTSVSIISNCYNIGDVSAAGNSVYVGGICGYNVISSVISNCYNIGDISADGQAAFVGGICGFLVGGVGGWGGGGGGGGSDNTIESSSQVTLGQTLGHEFTVDSAPILRITEKNTGKFANEEFRLSLSNAEWNIKNVEDYKNYINDPANELVSNGEVVDIDIVSETTILVEIRADANRINKAFYRFPLVAKINEYGYATVTVDPRESRLSSGTYLFAYVPIEYVRNCYWMSERDQIVNGLLRDDTEKRRVGNVGNTTAGRLTDAQMKDPANYVGFDFNTVWGFIAEFDYPVLRAFHNIPVQKTVFVGTQSGTLTAGTAGSVTFPITTTNIVDGSYIVSVDNLPIGVSVQGQVTVSNSSGMLTLTTDTTTIAGTTSSLRLALDGATSNPFTLMIYPITINTCTISIPMVSQINGQPAQIRIPINITDNPGLVSFQMDITYDHSVLTPAPVAVEQGVVWNTSIISNTNVPGKITLAGSSVTRRNGDGAIAYISFNVNPGAQDGTYPVEIEVIRLRTDDGQYNQIDIPYTTENGAVLLARRGHVLGENIITASDATEVLWYDAGLKQLTPSQLIAADVTGPNGVPDGIVDIRDAVKILRIAVGLDSPPSANPSQHTPAIAAASGSVSIGSEIELSIGSATGKPGNTVTLPVIIEGNTGIAGFTFDIEYDATRLIPRNVTEGAAWQNYIAKNLVFGDGLIRISGLSPQNSILDGTLFEVTFEIKNDADVGKAHVNLNVNLLINEQSADTLFQVKSNGEVEVISATGTDGVEVSCSVRSYNPNNATTIELFQGGEVKYVAVIGAVAGSGQVVQSFSITGVAVGDYTLKVTKDGHLSYAKLTLTVGSSNIDFGEVTLIPGDINGDGQIDGRDFTILSEDFGRSGQGIANPLADLNGDEQVDGRDFTLLSEGFGKSAIVEP